MDGLVVAFALEGGHGHLQNLVVGGLATACWSDDHESVTHLNGVVKLDDFDVELLDVLQVHLLAAIFDCLSQITVCLLWACDSWEEIDDDVLEQWKIVFQELWHVDVSESSQKELVLIKLWVRGLELTSGIDDGTHGSHTVVVMILTGELL